MQSIGACSRSASAIAVVLVVMATSFGCGGQKEQQDQRGAPAASSQASAAPTDLFSNGNTLGIHAGVTAPSTFTVTSGSVRLVGLTTYHYVGPSGVPATGTVGLWGTIAATFNNFSARSATASASVRTVQLRPPW